MTQGKRDPGTIKQERSSKNYSIEINMREAAGYGVSTLLLAAGYAVGTGKLEETVNTITGLGYEAAARGLENPENVQGLAEVASNVLG